MSRGLALQNWIAQDRIVQDRITTWTDQVFPLLGPPFLRQTHRLHRFPANEASNPHAYSHIGDTQSVALSPVNADVSPESLRGRSFETGYTDVGGSNLPLI